MANQIVREYYSKTSRIWCGVWNGAGYDFIDGKFDGLNYVFDLDADEGDLIATAVRRNRDRVSDKYVFFQIRHGELVALNTGYPNVAKKMAEDWNEEQQRLAESAEDVDR